MPAFIRTSIFDFLVLIAIVDGVVVVATSVTVAVCTSRSMKLTFLVEEFNGKSEKWASGVVSWWFVANVGSKKVRI